MKTNNSNKKSKASKARKINRKKSNRGGQSGFNSSAAVAVSNDLQQFVKFSAGRKDSTLRVHAQIPLYQISSNSTAGSTPQIGSFLANGVNYAHLALNPLYGLNNPVGAPFETAVSYLSPVTNLLGATFVRYQIHKLKFCYEPQSSTTVNDRLVFAFAEDPDHPLIRVEDNLTQDDLLSLSTSIAFAPWRSWEMDVSSTIKQDLMYVYDESSQTTNRFAFYGIMGCVSSFIPTTDDTPATVYGILYGNITIDFVEFCPVTTSQVGLTRRGPASRSRKLTNVGDKDCENEAEDPAKKKSKTDIVPEKQLVRSHVGGKKLH